MVPRTRMRCEERIALAFRVPEDGKDAFIVLTGGGSEIGVKPSRAEFRCCECKAHIILSGLLAGFVPASADFCALISEHAVVGMALFGLVHIGDDLDAGGD